MAQAFAPAVAQYNKFVRFVRLLLFSRISLRRLTAQSALCSRISSASFCVYFFPPLLSTAKPPPCGNERQNHASFRRVPPFALPLHLKNPSPTHPALRNL